MQFITQQNHYSCGPVAIYNLLQFYKQSPCINCIHKKTKCNPRSGTSMLNISKTLQHYNISFSNGIVQDGNVFVFEYKHPNYGLHIVFAYKLNNRFLLINDFQNGKYKKYTFKSISQWKRLISKMTSAFTILHN